MTSIWKGNRLPVLEYQFTVDDVAFDLTGSTVTFSMRPTNSATLKVSAATATQSSPTTGDVTYAWASGDTDTVGNYWCWMTYSINGKSQDAPEFALSVIEHAPTSVQISYPVGAGGATSIYQGDAYLLANNRQLQYEVMPMDSPDLTGATIQFKVEGGSTYTMTLVGEDAVYLELTSTQTTAITNGTYNFAIRANVSTGNYVTLLRSTLTVTAALT